jgi:hypothetical protein
VEHLRDLRSELLLKLVLAELCERITRMAAAFTPPPNDEPTTDFVALWRHESSRAALRFLARLAPSGGGRQGISSTRPKARRLSM